LHLTNWNGLVAPLLELARVTSWATFVKKAKCLSLEAEGERLKLIPNRNLGTEDGFEPVPECAIELSFPSSPDQIGAAIQEMIARCQ
jgi:hypothetical protein